MSKAKAKPKTGIDHLRAAEMFLIEANNHLALEINEALKHKAIERAEHLNRTAEDLKRAIVRVRSSIPS